MNPYSKLSLATLVLAFVGVWLTSSILARGAQNEVAIQRSDGHPDLSMSAEQLQAICDLVNGIRAFTAIAQTDTETPRDLGAVDVI